MSLSLRPWQRFASALLDVLAPRACAGCGVPCPGALCPVCERRLESPPVRWLRGLPVIAAAGYAPPISEAIRQLKYGQRADLALPLARLVLERQVAATMVGRHVLVPVPLHPARLAERGYNQSALLAAALARQSGAAFAPLALRRSRDTPQLAGRSRSARAAAMAGAFTIRPGGRRLGRTVVLVDDVVTTGATAGACVDALRGGGLSVELVVAVAVAEPSGHAAERCGADARACAGPIE